jgi:hypothetical protein
LSGGFKFLRNTGSRTKVHLVRRLPTECRMWKTRMVLLDVKDDQLLDASDGVELVQEQPLVLEHAPPGFDPCDSSCGSGPVTIG